MQFFETLYLGQKVTKVNKIKKQILNRSIFVNAYVITLACNEDQLEIFDAKVLRQRYYQSNPRTIIGIAADYEEAVELLLEITKDSLTQGYEGRLKQFLIDKETK